MDAGKIFVGRKAELEQFKEALNSPKGQAVLVVGQAGMGKTWLVNEMTEIAENHPDLKCGWVRYEVTRTDSVDSTMSLMMDNAFEAASTEPGSFDRVFERKKQWLALFKTIVPKGGEIAELINSLRRDPTRNTREQFLGRLRLISKRMPDKGRAIFVIDPEKYMQADSDQSWAIVVKELPDKIKFVFAQRPEDALVESETFGALDNLLQIPEKRLDILDEESVDELINRRVAGLKYSVTEVREVLKKYKGHPYALQGSLDLLKAGIKLEELPKDPTGIAAAQWKELSKRGKETIRLFKAYAILEVGVPNEVVESVSELDNDTLQSLLADKYLAGLLRDEWEGKRIYHAILMDYIFEQIGEAERKEYHSRAVGIYRKKLAMAREQHTKPDALAAMRLAEHVLPAEGEIAFVYAIANESGKMLLNLGLLDASESLLLRALEMVKVSSKEEAVVTGNLGVIYQKRGDLDKAEKMFREGLKIDEKLGNLKGIASRYGNLGLIYRTRGELDKAEQMHKRALEIEKKLGWLEGMAGEYGNLGLIYQKQSDLDKAEKMFRKGLNIDENLCRLEGIASKYVNLGTIYRIRGDLDKAEDMCLKSLEIAEKLGLQGIMASDYGNLGVIYQIRGELDKAEEMHLKSIEIVEKLGLKKGVANEYGNLGNIYRKRGDFEKAKKMYNRVLEIEKKLGRPDSIALAYGNLGVIYKNSGELDKAEEMYLKSLKVKEKLGLQEGMSISYGNLGNVYYTRGDLDKAEDMHKKAMEIDEKIGHLEGVARHSANLGLVYQKRGDIDKVREYWEMAVELYKRIGMPHEVEEIEKWISELED